MLHAREADEIWLAALVNLTAVVDRCVERNKSIFYVLARVARLHAKTCCWPVRSSPG